MTNEEHVEYTNWLEEKEEEAFDDYWWDIMQSINKELPGGMTTQEIKRLMKQSEESAKKIAKEVEEESQRLQEGYKKRVEKMAARRSEKTAKRKEERKTYTDYSGLILFVVFSVFILLIVLLIELG